MSGKVFVGVVCVWLWQRERDKTDRHIKSHFRDGQIQLTIYYITWWCMWLMFYYVVFLFFLEAPLNSINMMGRKCTVYSCTSGYVEQNLTEKVSIYRFPDDEQECRHWFVCLPNKLQVAKFMGICALHWPADTLLVHKGRGQNLSLAAPSSIFPLILVSCVRSHISCKPRPTKKNQPLSSLRNPNLDEMKVFREQDSLKSASFQAHFMDYFSHLYGWEHEISKSLQASWFLATLSQKAWRLYSQTED